MTPTALYSIHAASEAMLTPLLPSADVLSVALQVNVFTLGMVFQQLVKLLNMESNAMLARCESSSPCVIMVQAFRPVCVSLYHHSLDIVCIPSVTSIGGHDWAC